jgi:hypothetical protein
LEIPRVSAWSRFSDGEEELRAIDQWALNRQNISVALSESESENVVE